MTIAEEQRPRFNIDWVCVKRATPFVGAVVLAFAIGGWVRGINDKAADLPYKNRSTATLEVIHKEVGANPVAQIKCDRKVAAAVATVLRDKAADDTTVAALPVQVCPPPTPTSAIAPK